MWSAEADVGADRSWLGAGKGGECRVAGINRDLGHPMCVGCVHGSHHRGRDTTPDEF